MAAGMGVLVASGAAVKVGYGVMVATGGSTVGAPLVVTRPITDSAEHITKLVTSIRLASSHTRDLALNIAPLFASSRPLPGFLGPLGDAFGASSV